LHDLLFPACSEMARPLDLFEHDPPSVLSMSVERPWGSWLVVGAVNWGDTPATRTLDLDALGVAPAPARHHVFSAFDRHYYGAVKGELPLGLMPPHSVRLLSIREALDRPQILATSFHVSQGGTEIASCAWSDPMRELTVTFSMSRPRKGTLFVHVPACYGSPQASGSTNVTSLQLAGPLLTLELETTPGCALTLAFEKH
jgi:hypothetical protein